MILIYVAVFIANVCIANGQSSCRTPSGGDGECIDVYSCQTLLDLIRNPDRTQQELIDLLKKSKCGDNEYERKVCCPTFSEPPATLTSREASSCFTAEGDIGECVNILSCLHLANKLKLRGRAFVPQSDIAYVQKSRCQGPEKYSVCCRSNPEQVTKVILSNCKERMSAFPPDPQSKCCGIDSKFANRILGGNETTVDQYPWLALIEYVKKDVIKLLCGGTLISSKYVLTAANCFTGYVLKMGTPQSVRLGEYDINHDGMDCAAVEGGGEDCTDGVTRIPIEKTIPHPQFNPVDAQKRHDIALLRLKQYAPYTEFIRPICLPTLDLTLPQNIPRNFILFAAGWGQTARGHSHVKKHVDLPYIDPYRCQPAYNSPGRRFTLSRSHMCAGGVQGKDTCKGDIGGPLMYKAGSYYEIIGIVSFGPYPCGLEGIPGVYSKVFEYLQWIRYMIVP